MFVVIKIGSWISLKRNLFSQAVNQWVSNHSYIWWGNTIYNVREVFAIPYPECSPVCSLSTTNSQNRNYFAYSVPLCTWHLIEIFQCNIFTCIHYNPLQGTRIKKTNYTSTTHTQPKRRRLTSWWVIEIS